ncbi:MAG: peptide chain release factor-like protein [Verrucomicrobiae bacterium]|nr:peptide chain release factor-like protein [Verrucomicrobiae bacterium]
MRRMEALGVAPADFDETFVRSSGHGGQNVNKTSTCVVLVHRATGTQVRCQDTRQQGRNRALAWRLMIEKLEAERVRRADEERARREKQRRRNRPRSRRSKARILADKARRGEKKAGRRPVGTD